MTADPLAHEVAASDDIKRKLGTVVCTRLEGLQAASAFSCEAAPSGDLPQCRKGAPQVTLRSRRHSSVDPLELIDEDKVAALEDDEKDKHASSASLSRSVLVTTWQRFLNLWYGEETALLPVEPSDISHVACLMKRQGYQSVANYLDRIKELHIRAGFEWSPQHEIEVRQGSRSVTRGQGPPRQSAPFEVPSLLKLRLGIEPRAAAVMLGCAYMRREIELAGAWFSHMFLDRVRRVVCLDRSCSKTGPTAIGCSRSWGCICTGRAEEEDNPCPYRTAVFHEDRLRLQFGKGTKVIMPADPPWFPTLDERSVYKEAVVKTIEAMAQQLGEPLADPWGRRRYGGHGMRVSGAKWLAAIGVEVSKIQTLAHWSSDVVSRYLGESHIGAIAGDVRRARTARKAVDGIDYSSFDKELANADSINVQEVTRDFKQEFQESIAAVKDSLPADSHWYKKGRDFQDDDWF